MSKDLELSEKGSFAKLIEEQLTLRTQYGLVVLFAVAMIYAISWLMGTVEVQSVQAQTLQSELEIWSDTEAQNEWRLRSEETEETLKDWHASAWNAGSRGVAAAEIEIAIQAIANEANVPAARIDVSAETTTQLDSDFLRFDVSGSLPIGNIPRLLVQFAAHQKQLVITDVQLVTRNQSTTNFQISGVAPFRETLDGAQN